MQELQRRTNQYEASKKSELARLATSEKPYNDILVHVKNEIAMSTKMADFRYKILCFRTDGVYQLNKAIEKIYGTSSAGQEDAGPSGGKRNIQTLDVRLADGTRVKVPYGDIDLPELGEDAHISIKYDSDNSNLLISGSTEFRWSSMIDEIVEETIYRLNTQSIYKDQAIELDSNYEPAIMNLSNIDKEFMVMSKKTEYDLQPLMARILKPEVCKAKGIPLKTGVLLEGPYGTGKTLLAFKIAQQAIANGWSFIYLKDPKLLAHTLRMCKTLDNNGNGVIVFVEDVDQVTNGERTDALQDILNTLDGGDTKQMNVIALFTTNHLEKINKTFLRGKRIGCLVSMGFLDEETAKQFLVHTFKDHYELDMNGLDEVCQKIANEQIVPAFMAEITETVKSHMTFAEDNIVKAEYINNSLESYLRQVRIARPNITEPTNEQKLYNAFTQMMADSKIGNQVAEVHNQICCD